MDRSLDDVIQARQNSRPRERRPPRDGIRKNYRRDDSHNLDRDWVHDRYDEDSDSRPQRDTHPARLTRRDPVQDSAQLGAKIKVENIHWDLTEDDLRELFGRIGPIKTLNLVYDRQDRSTGVAYVVYPDPRDGRTAIQEFDGANANGQPIRLSLVPNAPGKSQRNPFDSIDRPARSLFDRVDESERRRRAGALDDDDEGEQRPSNSRRSNVSKPAPDYIDRYVPGQQDNDDMVDTDTNRRPGSSRQPRRSPRRDSRGRGGRRPGQRRPQHDPRDADGHLVVQGRPRKTAEELDAEMTDYWNGQKGDAAASTAKPAEGKGNGVNPLDGDIDMEV